MVDLINVIRSRGHGCLPAVSRNLPRISGEGRGLPWPCASSLKSGMAG